MRTLLIFSVILRFHGEVAERFKAAVLKTVEGQPSGGSNPSLSANFVSNWSISARAPILLVMYSARKVRDSECLTLLFAWEYSFLEQEFFLELTFVM
jgi:hypothetical protein